MSTTVVASAPSTGEPADTVEQLRRDEERHAQNVRRAYESGIAQHCVHVDQYIGEDVDRRPNPNLPYLSWQCCPVHRQLKAERELLDARAATLGVETTYMKLIQAMNLGR